MSEVATIILGVVSGIITTAALYVVGLLFKSFFIPWYQAVTYKGVDINGTWEYESTAPGQKAKFEMTIVQRAHMISGDATILQGQDLNNPTTITNLRIDGGIWEGYITLNMQSKDRTRLSYSTSLLRVLHGGLVLQGNYVFRSIKLDEIHNIEMRWRRKK
ncbi:hypothetical protein I6E84_07490 [Psychrobacter sp. SCQQ22]|uniref:hypothetical protein n=1 Tax=unclassified Psychrobacter TaxID=196806 RepID=UPI0018CDF34D|nr:hypothetical protein [Psychrobacter sp. SCQQ22]MBH0086058.1 hypothetical protein [Psychrobacter sp. SCQQ22]